MIQDLRFAVRRLADSRRFTAVAVLTLAVGMAATASTFSVVKGLLLDPLPYPEPDRLAQVWTKDVDALLEFVPLSTPDFLDLDERLTSFEAFGTFTPRRFNVGGAHAETVNGAACTPGVFRAFNVPPLHGRVLTRDDVAGAGAAAVVVLSHAFWRQRFGSDPGAIGRTLRLDGRDVTIVGVMPQSFELLSTWTRDRALSLWTPLTLRRGPGGRSNHWMASIARLAPGVSADRAGEELRAIADEIRRSSPETNGRKTFWLMPLQQGLGGMAALRVSALLGAAWTLLVLAGQGVAGMMLARGVSRQTELAVRMALGAGRLRIVRLVLAEGLVLAVLAGGAGLLLTLWILDALAAALPANAMPRAGLAVDAWLLSSIAVLAIVVVQMSGLAPAMLASRTNVVTQLKEGGGSSERRTYRRLRALVIVQTALALLLVSVAVQLSNTYWQMMASAGATASAHVITAAVAVKGPQYDGDRRLAFWKRFVAETAALPGVTEAAVSSKLPFEGGIGTRVLIERETYDPGRFRPYTEVSYVTPRFLPAIGATLLAGRFLTEQDFSALRRVVVVNRAMESRYWPGRSAIGGRIRPAQSGTSWEAEVVGVVEDVRQVPERPAKPEMYFPFSDEPSIEAFLVVRMRADVPPAIDGIRAALGRVDSDLALSDVRSLRDRVEDATRTLTVVTRFVGALTIAILGLAALGLYGTLSFTFARRRREIGMRVALGAVPRDIVALVVRQALAWVAIGAAMGVAASWLLARGLRAVLEDASPVGVPQLAASVAIVLAAAALASWLPARRAVRVDPAVVLRAE